MKKCLIIIPAYNEAESIEHVADNIINNYPQYDYIIINDGSIDATKRVCNKKKYHIINLPVNLGIGGAVQTGYKYAKEYGYKIAVQIDGDGQHDIFYLDEMLQFMETENADIVIGSRYVNREGFQSSKIRRFGILFLSYLGKILTGIRVRDITSGYRVVNEKFIDIFSKDYPLDYPEPEAVVIAAVHGGKIKEYPVIMRERENGKSSITFKRSLYYMIKVTLAMFVRRLSLGVRRKK